MKKIIVLILIISFYGCAKTSTLTTKKLFNAEQLNALDQPIIYPTQQPAQVSSVVRVLKPGEETGWHKHMVPLHAYVMEGTLSIDFEIDGLIQTETFSKGEAWIGAVDVWHNAFNRTDQPAAMMVVVMGADGLKNTINR